MVEVMQYITPALVLGVGVFVGRTNTSITDLRREFQEFKVACDKKICSKKVTR